MKFSEFDWNALKEKPIEEQWTMILLVWNAVYPILPEREAFIKSSEWRAWYNANREFFDAQFA